MRYKTRSKEIFKNPKFGCDVLNEFYEGKTLKMYEATMFGLSAYTNFNLVTAVNGYDLLAHVYEYHTYIPDSFKLFEFLLNSDIDINMKDRNNHANLFKSLIMNNNLKWFSTYVNNKWFDDSIINKIYHFDRVNITPLQYTIQNKQYKMLNILMQHGAIPYNNIESDIMKQNYRFKISTFRELERVFSLVGIENSTEKLFGLYLKSYCITTKLNKYFMKKTFDINYLIEGINYIMLLITQNHMYDTDYIHLLTWMLDKKINLNLHNIVQYLINPKYHINQNLIIKLVEAGLKIENPKEFLKEIKKKLHPDNDLIKCISSIKN